MTPKYPQGIEDPCDYVRINIGSWPLGYAHYACAKSVMAAYEYMTEMPMDWMTVYSLKLFDNNGMPILYENLRCQIDHA